MKVTRLEENPKNFDQPFECCRCTAEVKWHDCELPKTRKFSLYQPVDLYQRILWSNRDGSFITVTGSEADLPVPTSKIQGR